MEDLHNFSFSSKQKFIIDEKEIAKSTNIEIISYCPEEFEKIRNLDGLSIVEMEEALDEELNRNQVFKAGEGSGASGSFFFFSHCNKLLIKTLRRDEKNVMLNMISDYYNHI